MKLLEQYEYQDPAKVLEQRERRERKKKRKLSRVEAEKLFKEPRKRES